MLTPEDLGLLYLLQFFKSNEGVIDVNTSDSEVKRILEVRYNAKQLILFIMESNELVQAALAKQKNIFDQLDPFYLKLVIVQLGLLGFVDYSGTHVEISDKLNIFKGSMFPINIFYVPKELITNSRYADIEEILKKTTTANSLNFLNRFLSKYLKICQHRNVNYQESDDM